MGIMNKILVGVLVAFALVGMAGFAVAGVVDTIAPTITDDYAYDGVWINSDQTITLSPFDGESGIDYVMYCMDGPGCNPSLGDVLNAPYQLGFSTASKNLNAVVKYQTWDFAGNPSAIGQFNVKIDGLVSETTASGVPSGWVNDSAVVTLTALDVNFPGAPGSGIENIYYCIDKDNTCVPTDVTTGEVNVSDEGTNYLRFYSEDVAGNKEDVQFVIVNITVVSPVVTFDDLSTNDNTPTLTGTVDDADASVSIDIGDGNGYVNAVNNGDGTWTYQVDSAIADGEYNISVKAVDGEGDEGTDEGTLEIDSTAPEVVIESPLNQTYDVGNVSVIVAVNDENLESIEYSIDGGVTKTALVYDNVTGKYSALMVGLANGPYVLNVYCNDSFGNSNDTQSVEFSVNVIVDDGDDGDGGNGGGGDGGSGGGSGGGGGGGGSSCYESNWTYSEWGSCINGTQARTCTSNCNTNKTETQACVILPKTSGLVPIEPETPTGWARITGAIIGALNNGAWNIAAIFLAIIVGLAIFLRIRK